LANLIKYTKTLLLSRACSTPILRLLNSKEPNSRQFLELEARSSVKSKKASLVASEPLLRIKF
jgi:hypothetical protein